MFTSLRRTRFALPFILCALLSLAACENSVEPDSEADLLKATINGIALDFAINTDVAGAPAYDAALMKTSFGGTIVGNPTRGLSLSFISDITGGTYPRAVPGGDITMVYTESATGYTCSIDSSDCQVTLTSSNGSTVQGTFQGTLRDPSNTARIATVVNGSFRVKVR